MKRPSKREVYNKILVAKESVSDGLLLILNPEIIAEDAIELGYLINDLKTVLLKLLDEIKLNNYAGTHPPQKSYNPEIEGAELFAFRWKSAFFGCEVYLKYSLKNEKFYLVSLHPHREKEGGENELSE